MDIKAFVILMAMCYVVLGAWKMNPVKNIGEAYTIAYGGGLVTLVTIIVFMIY
jgi:hypothetical protein